MFSLASIVPGSHLRMHSLQLRLNSAGRLLADSDSVTWDSSCREDLQWWSDDSDLLVGLPLGLSQPDLSLFTDASDSGWGASLGDDHFSGSWSPHCSAFSMNHRELLAVLYGVRGFLPLLRLLVSQLVCGQHHRSGLPEESGGHSFFSTQFRGSGDPASLRVPPGLLSPSVHPRSSEHHGRLPQSSFAGPRFGVDPVFSSFPGSPSSVVCDDRLVRDVSQPSASGILLDDGRSSVGGHGCDDAAVGWSSGLCLPSLRPSPASHREGPTISGVGAHGGCSFLASAPLVSGPSGASGGCPSVPSMSEGSTQTASLPSFPPEAPPCFV